MSAKKTKSVGTTKGDGSNPADQRDEEKASGIVDEATEEAQDPPQPDTDYEASPEAAEEIKDADAADSLTGDEDVTEADEKTSSDDAVEEDATEVAETSEPEHSAPEPEKVIERVIEKRSVFVPAIFGGVVAAGLGFAVGISDRLAPYLPESLQRGGQTDALEDRIATLQTQLSELSARVDQAPAAPDLSGVEALVQDGLTQQADALSASEATLSARLDALETQISDIAQRPVDAAISDEAVAAYERELAAVQDALAQQRAEVETMIAEAAQMEAEASESARLAQAQAAATRLFAALDTGQPYTAEVTELQGLGVTVPDALAVSAEGLVSLGSLQADFPELARAALSEARAAEGGSGGFTGFLQRQLGARSVTPRDGDNPDAVLSRAEAALTSGDLTQVLSELDSLPDVADAQLADWAARVAARRDALAAADELAQSLSSN